MKDNGNFTNENVQDAMRFAQSDAGKQLFAHLQKTQGQQLQDAMNMAASGNYAQVKKALSSLLADPEARKLLENMRK